MLDCFSSWSSQLPNCDKSMVHFSNNTQTYKRNEILNILGFIECTHNNKHLGLHFCKHPSRKIAFNSIFDKISSCLKDWKAKVLSQASRTILIKDVAQAIPTYSMSTSLLPINICNKLDGKIRKFWWGENDKGN